LILLPDDLADVFFRLEPGCHDLMAAAKTSQAKIRPGSQHKPSLFTAWVFFFHNEHIIKPDIHGYLLGISGK
jgi:hypothetical protein